MTHPQNASTRQKVIDDNPFKGMKIDDSSFLSKLEGRNPCPKCGKSRKYFCYTCYVPILQLEGKLPKIKLPIKIDIIKHRNEIDGKSTAAHAAVLSVEDVKVYTYPNIPQYDENSAVLIFPSSDAIQVQKLFEDGSWSSNDVEDVTLPNGHCKRTLMTEISKPYIRNKSSVQKKRIMPIKKAIFIDSTWNQSKGIYKDENIKKLQCVVLQNRISQFWRHQKGSPRWYLATIEAIHQFIVEIHVNMWGLDAQYEGLQSYLTEKHLDEFQGTSGGLNSNLYNGQYDNLLFFFKHMYELIHEYYDHDTLYAYKRRLQ